MCMYVLVVWLRWYYVYVCASGVVEMVLCVCMC